MLRKPLLSLLLALLLGGAFVYGIAQLFLLRYATGDIYPPYSSLRTDPLGTKALAAALDELPGVEVRRNFKPLPRLQAGRPVTLIYTGVPHRAFWTEQELAAFDGLIARGSRAVFTFSPIAHTPRAREERRVEDSERDKKKEKIENRPPDKKKAQPPKKKEAAKKAATPAPDAKEPGDKNGEEEAEQSRQTLISFATVAKRWGVAFAYLPEEEEAFPRRRAHLEPGGDLEPQLSWHTALHFRDLKPQWTVLYRCATQPVVIERRYGDGSLVLVADSFLLSNEALRRERHPRLLARLFAGPPLVIFDEESRGLRDDPGIASLARKYQLHGVVAGLFLLAGLFVWKNMVRFLPAYDSQAATGDVIAGKESGEGFINLLRRSLRPSAMLETCVAEWRKSFAHQPRELARVEEIYSQEQSRSPRARNPIAAYRAIAAALTRRK